MSSKRNALPFRHKDEILKGCENTTGLTTVEITKLDIPVDYAKENFFKEKIDRGCISFFPYCKQHLLVAVPLQKGVKLQRENFHGSYFIEVF
ncbi:hypothetical protein AVEN_261528-1 [Araneus ventricosus]|uniref:Uncharacterized protein n=1 Tax=Araneus ventricosus TaxID=182803 RepID=A0A4Y2L632_ARAVE|nr:hypothetical protein AVEN_261528-1 [Araneus ventricosus]